MMPRDCDRWACPSALRPPHLAQLCAVFDGYRCRVYADRPQYCREFECVLLKSVQAGHTETDAALRITRRNRSIAMRHSARVSRRSRKDGGTFSIRSLIVASIPDGGWRGASHARAAT